MYSCPDLESSFSQLSNFDLRTSSTCAGDHDFIVDEVKKAAISVEEVQSVSEVQVYYKDSGEIACKVDIVLPPSLTIKQAHSIAGTVYGLGDAARCP